MTWQELATEILALAPAELAMPAMVFPPPNCPHDAGVPITGLVAPSLDAVSGSDCKQTECSMKSCVIWPKPKEKP